MTTKNEKFKNLLGAMTAKTGGGGNGDWKRYFQFWKAPIDSQIVIRFLPDLNEDNSFQFYVVKYHHELFVNGKKEYHNCRATWGEQCPICAASAKAYAENDEVLGKQLYRKKSFISQVIVVESPIEHDASKLVKLIEYGPAIQKTIISDLQSGDLEEVPYEYKGGHNFRINKTQSGKNASYTTSKFAPRPTDLDDDVIEAAKAEMIDLSSALGKMPSYDESEALLTAFFTGQSYAPDDGDSGSDAPAKFESRPASSQDDDAPATQAESAPAPSASGAAPKSAAAAAALARLKGRPTSSEE